MWQRGENADWGASSLVWSRLGAWRGKIEEKLSGEFPAHQKGDALRRRIAHSVLNFALYARIGIVFPFVFLHLLAEGLSVADVSRAFMTAAITSMLTQQWWGYIADEVLSRRKTLLILIPLSVLVHTAWFVDFAWIAPLPPWIYIMIVAGVSGCINPPINQAATSLLFADHYSSPAYPVIRSIGSAGFLVANLSIGFAARYFGFPFYYTIIVFLICSWVSIISCLCLPELQISRSADARLSFKRVQGILLGNPRLLGMLIFVILYHMPFAMANYTLQPAMIKDVLGGNTDTQALCSSIGALAEIPFFLVGDILIRKFGAFRCLMVATMASLVRWTGFFYATEPWHAVALSTLHAFSFGTFYFGAVRYVDENASPRLKASAQTLFGIAFYGASTTLANILAPYLLNGLHLSIRDCYLVVSGLVACALIFLAVFWVLEKRWPPAVFEEEEVAAA